MNAPERPPGMKPTFNWQDPLLLFDQLTEDERMVRERRARLCAGQADAARPRCVSPRDDRSVDLPRDGRARPARGDAARRSTAAPGLNYVCYGLIAREIERVDSGYRSMMSVQSSLVMFPIHDIRQRGAAAEIPAEARDRRVDRLLRPDRAQPRLRSRLDGDARATRRRRLSSARRQDVDLEFADRRRVRRVGEGRRRRRSAASSSRRG